MWTRTFTAHVEGDGSPTTITFYREIPGGWKLDFRDAQGEHVANGDRWVETIDDLVLQLGNYTNSDPKWRTEDGDRVSFYAAVRECVLEARTS
ncbi:hypothetical protein [Alteriqipengyuania sp.]|uniref:hypothetical protein n=1 Tax=Alteriqipengyuania sp. TaxID=2800692 RepID=UPI003518EB46